ncbi:Probable LRR receptor-like serine/threonine-protein kinase At1g69990 [Linum perenne]
MAPLRRDANLFDNSLPGSIPPEIVNCQLDRLKKFSVANNGHSSSIPVDLATFPEGDFEGNGKLCSWPLEKCGGLSSKSLGIIIAAGVVGATGSLVHISSVHLVSDLALAIWQASFRWRRGCLTCLNRFILPSPVNISEFGFGKRDGR